MSSRYLRLSFDRLQARRSILLWNSIADKIRVYRDNCKARGPKSFAKAAREAFTTLSAKNRHRDMDLYFLQGFV